MVIRIAPIATPLSIITATFNSASTLNLLYDSLCAQTDSRFEWIVVDGGSSDSTIDMLEAYAAQHSWITIVLGPDFGIYDALNKGIQRALGKFYLVVGSDDTLSRDAIEKFQKASTGEVDVVLASVQRDGHVISGFRPKLAWLGHQQVFGGSHSVGMLIRKSLHTKHGYYSNRFPMLADGFFLKKLIGDKNIKFKEANFVAGIFSIKGISSTNKLQSLAETWQIQMLTERFRLLQIFIFFVKVLLKINKLIKT